MLNVDEFGFHIAPEMVEVHERCLVHGHDLGLVAISSQLLLSSNTWQITFGIVCKAGNPLERNSVIKFMMVITSLKAEDNVMYSASVVLSATSGCILEPHRIGHPA